MMNATLRGKPDAGNPHVRFDEGEVASAKPRRGSLLYKIDVKYVSDLARLKLTEEEAATFQGQLENIVKYVEKISEVNVDGIEPMMHGRKLVNAFREDVVRPSLATETALGNAPQRVGDEFLLPKIVEGAES